MILVTKNRIYAILLSLDFIWLQYVVESQDHLKCLTEVFIFIELFNQDLIRTQSDDFGHALYAFVRTEQDSN